MEAHGSVWYATSPLREKVAAEGCRMRGMSPQQHFTRGGAPHPASLCAASAALSHKGRGRSNWAPRSGECVEEHHVSQPLLIEHDDGVDRVTLKSPGKPERARSLAD